MNKLFVVGAPRSGTTYLGRALGLADDTAYYEESDKKDTVASYIKTFENKSNHFNKMIPRGVTLKKICNTCLYYERLESWLGEQENCRIIPYTDLITNPLETVEATLLWAGFEFDQAKHEPVFKAGVVSSHWGKLCTEDQMLISRNFDD